MGDNLIDDDLSADSKNLATDFAYLYTLVDAVVSSGVVLLVFVHVWKWNILTSAAVYGLSLSAFGLNVITAGFAMRSAGRRDNTFDNGARTVDLDSNHTIHHALSVVSAVVTAVLAFCVVYLRGGYKWADEAQLAFRGVLGGAGPTAGAAPAGPDADADANANATDTDTDTYEEDFYASYT